MRRTAWLMLAGAVVLVVALVILPPLLQCKVNRGQVVASALAAFALPTAQGYVVVVKFNVTNLSDCQLTAESIQATLRDATNKDGIQKAIGATETQALKQIIHPNGGTAQFSYAFDQYLGFKPIKLSLSISVKFADVGGATIFDGEVTVS